MKWPLKRPRWRIVFVGGSVKITTGASPEKAARRIARRTFGRRAEVRRIAGLVGEEGAFEVFERSTGNPLTMFDVDPLGIE